MSDKNHSQDNEIDDFVVEEETETQSSFSKNKDIKFKKLEEELDKCKKEKQEYLDGWQRSKADFINARKRDEEDKKSLVKYAEANLISELIPALDAFDMAMGNKEVWEKADKSWRTGIEYIHSQISSVLEQHGLTKVSPLGIEFDPSLHHSVSIIETNDEKQDGKILEVISAGYSLNGKIIREAQVKVGKFKRAE